MAKNIFATACSAPLASLSEGKSTGEKILSMKNILQKIRST
jgi:hypothetical protein